MAATGAVSPAISARIVHGALVFGVMMFGVIAWTINGQSLPAEALPNRRLLYIGLTLVSAVLFGAAVFSAGRLQGTAPQLTEDEWWRTNLGRAVVVWALVEAPALLGLLAYALTRDFRTLLAPFIGLLFFAAYRPSRLTER